MNLEFRDIFETTESSLDLKVMSPRALDTAPPQVLSYFICGLIVYFNSLLLFISCVYFLVLSILPHPWTISSPRVGSHLSC